MNHNIYLAIGSNIGDKKKNIQQTIILLQGKISKIRIACLYETYPMYYTKQETFFNTALFGETKLTPIELLMFTQDIELKIGRKKRFSNGPREIDIDIIFYDKLVYVDPTLIIPHPRMQERDFVLQPLFDLNPLFVHPQLKQTIETLLRKLPDETRAIIQKINSPLVVY